PLRITTLSATVPRPSIVWILPFTSATTESAPGAGALADWPDAEPATAAAPAAPKVFKKFRRDVPSCSLVSLMSPPPILMVLPSGSGSRLGRLDHTRRRRQRLSSLRSGGAP